MRLRIKAIMSSASASENIRLGIWLWFERRKAFKESAVVDGRLAISSKLGGNSVLDNIGAKIS